MTKKLVLITTMIVVVAIVFVMMIVMEKVAILMILLPISSGVNAKIGDHNNIQSFNITIDLWAKITNKRENTILSFYVDLREFSWKMKAMVIFWILLKFVFL